GAVQWVSMGEPSGPSPRTRHTALWDLTPAQRGEPAYDRMLVFGGSTASGVTAEAWALGPTLSSWTQPPPSPAALAGQTAIYNPMEMWALDPEPFNPGTGQWTPM